METTYYYDVQANVCVEHNSFSYAYTVFQRGLPPRPATRSDYGWQCRHHPNEFYVVSKRAFDKFMRTGERPSRMEADIRLEDGMFAYKVVRVAEGNLSSAVGRATAVEYIKGLWTYPVAHAHRFLFAFRTRASARAFAKSRGNTVQIWRCRVKNPDMQRKGHSHTGTAFDARPGMFWPKDTIFADAIQLVEKVH